MKYIFYIIAFKLIPFLASAANYYFANAGSDGGACSLAAPCATVSKASGLTLSAGDSVLFKGGDTFFGTLYMNQSGTSISKIVYSSYGTGRAIISGFYYLSNWTSLGGTKSEAACPSCGSTVSLISFNGYDQPIGRWPDTTAANGPYRALTSGNTTSITDATLPSDTNWTGATIACRTANFAIDTRPITAQSGGVITVSPAFTYAPPSGYGYFIQNDIRTLTRSGEWYWNNASDSLIMYVTSPGSQIIGASAIDTLVSIGANYVTIDNLNIQGANKYLIAFTQNFNNDTIRNASLTMSGINAIENSKYGKKCSFNNINFKDIHNNGISAIFSGELDSCKVKNDSFVNISIIPGMAASGNAGNVGMTIYGYRDTMTYNYAYNLGGNWSTTFGGSLNYWQYNFINTFSTTICDGGGIYGSTHDGLKNTVWDNIIINGLGQKNGTTNSTNTYSSGIYIDNGGSFWDVQRNSLYGNSYGGIYTHFSRNCTFKNNICYSNGLCQWYWQEDNLADSMRGNIFKYNQFIAPSSNLCVAWYNSGLNDLNLIGTLDSNYYQRITSDNSTFKYTGGGGTLYSISGWKSQTFQDANSKTAPIISRGDANTLFLYNATPSPTVTTLTDSYIGVTGVGYAAGPLTLQPFTSVILFQFPKIVIR